MKILLVNPPSTNVLRWVGVRFLPLGPAYVAAALRNGGHTVHAVDVGAEDRNIHGIRYGDYDLVGIGSDTSSWPEALNIAAAARSAGKPVVVGGPHASFLDREALDTGLVDYVVRFEGEETMLDLVDHLEARADVGDVAGISFKRDGQVVRTRPRPFIQDLDSLPLPARDIFPLSRYKMTLCGRGRLMTVVGSRGCPYNCDFCACSAFAGTRWRTRSVGSILDEIEYLHRAEGYTAVAFVDDNFTADANRATAIAEGILARGLRITWWVFSRIEIATKHPDVVRLMARAGLVETFVGFESGDQQTLDDAGKRATVEDSLKAMEEFRRNRIRVWGAFMLGFADETEEMMRRTIRFARRLNPEVAQFSLVTPYPGTRLFERVRGRITATDWGRFWGGEPTFALTHVPAETLKRIYLEAYRKFYLRPARMAAWVPNMLRAWLRRDSATTMAMIRFTTGRLRTD